MVERQPATAYPSSRVDSGAVPPTAASGRVRVLILHPRDPAQPTIGGIQTFLHDFIKYAPADFELTFAGTTADRRARPIGRTSVLRIEGHDVRFLALSGSNGLPRDPLGLIGALSAQVRARLQMMRGGRILQVHRPYRSIFLAGQRGPRVQFIHVDIREWPGPSAWRHVRGVYRSFSSRALAGMSRVFVVNEAGAEIIRRDHAALADRVEFLPVWYDPDTFRPGTADERERARSELRGEIGLAASDALPLILFAGRLDAIKDPELAIDGLAELHRRGTAAQLVVCGSGALQPALAEQARRQGVDAYVHFVGDVRREHLAQMMRGVDVLLLTSRAEGGGPRVVVESLASGTPAVATPVGEVRRTVNHRGNGWLIDGRTAGAVADGLEWVLTQPAGALQDASIAAARPYTAERVLARVYDAYRRITAGQ
jgi:glycosyltransferase involved in cell wall biosynthesis